MPLFKFSPKIAKQNAKRRRLVRKGLAPQLSKDELRALADAAALSHPIKRIASLPIDEQIERQRQHRADWQTSQRIAQRIKE